MTQDLDCGDNSCRYAKTRGGMRTNGGCRCDECPYCGAHLGHPPGRGHKDWCQGIARMTHLLAQSGLHVVREDP